MLGLHGVQTKMINLMSEIYSGSESAVRCGDTISDLFPVVTGVCQGCVLAFQHRYSGEDVGEIKLRCIAWECWDL